MRDHYDDSLSLRDAVAAYFAANHFGADGGYGDKWVKLKLGPLSGFMPNTSARVAAVRFHDLHHLVTGYQTDWRGEFEISAWELAAGCGRFHAAWWLNLGGMNAGLLVCPRRTLSAFLLGRRCRSLYGKTYGAALLSQTVRATREAMGLSADGTAAQSQRTALDWLRDLAVLAIYYVASIPVSLLTLLAAIFVFVPVALLQGGKSPAGSSAAAGSTTPDKAPSSPAAT
jgi:hypothetical protein